MKFLSGEHLNISTSEHLTSCLPFIRYTVDPKYIDGGGPF